MTHRPQYSGRRVSPKRARLASTRPLSPVSPALSGGLLPREEEAKRHALASRRVLESPPSIASTSGAVVVADDHRRRSYERGLRSPSPREIPAEPPGFKEFVIRRDGPADRMGLSFDDEYEELKVTGVWPGPCKAAGIEKGMLVMAVDAVTVSNLDQLQRAIARADLTFVMEVQLSKLQQQQGAVRSASGPDDAVSVQSRHRKPLTYENAMAAAAHIVSAGAAAGAAVSRREADSVRAGGAAGGFRGRTASARAAVPSVLQIPQAQGADECEQLRLQLEAANVQVKSAQSRTGLAHERERELTDELVDAKQRLRIVEAELAEEVSKRQLAESDIKSLMHNHSPHSVPLAAVSALQEEVDALRQENSSLRMQQGVPAMQPPLAQTFDDAKYKELLRQFELERYDWERERMDLMYQLEEMRARVAEADVLKQELEVLTLTVRNGGSAPPASRHSSPPPPPQMPQTPQTPPMNRRQVTAPGARSSTLAAYAGQPGTKTVSPKSNLSYITPRKPVAVRESMLLSKRLEDEEDTTGRALVRSSSKEGSKDTLDSQRNGGSKEPAAPLSALDQRLEVLARRAKDAIRSAETRDDERFERPTLETRIKRIEQRGVGLRARALEDEKADKERRDQEDRERELKRDEEANTRELEKKRRERGRDRLLREEENKEHELELERRERELERRRADEQDRERKLRELEAHRKQDRDQSLDRERDLDRREKELEERERKRATDLDRREKELQRERDLLRLQNQRDAEQKEREAEDEERERREKERQHNRDLQKLQTQRDAERREREAEEAERERERQRERDRHEKELQHERDLQSIQQQRDAERKEREAAEAERERERELEKERELERERERRRADERAVVRARLLQERQEADERAKERELEREREKEKAKRDSAPSRESSGTPPPREFTTKAEAAAVFAKLKERGDVDDGVHAERLPELLGCSPTWKVLFRGLNGDDAKVVRLPEWLDWVRGLEEKSGPSEAESRLNWVKDQLNIALSPEGTDKSAFGGQTTRELAAEAKFSERLRNKKDEPQGQLSKVYGGWGNTPPPES